MKKFLKDKRGIEGLPMKLIIIVVIAGAVLAAVLMMIPKPGGTLNAECVTVDGTEGSLKAVSGSSAGSSGEITGINFDVTVKVTDGSGDPVTGADVTLTGADGAGAGKTGEDGTVTIGVQNAKLQANEDKDYLSVEVSAPNHKDFTGEKFVTIARTG